MSAIRATAANLATTILLVLYTLSGLTSLAFEVLWARMLSLQFGVSIFGVVVTVAAFMGGLGLGSLLALRALPRLRRPLLAFAALEAGIAVYALLLPWLLSAAESRLDALAPGVDLGVWYLLQGGALLILMLLPALAMGAGFPLVLKAASPSPFSLGRLYGLNACGAAAGALLPLGLLPAYGWSLAVQVVAGVGLAVAATAALLAVAAGASASATGSGGRVQGDGARPVPWSTVLAYAAIGAAAIMLEIGWTRLFGMVLLRTEYVLAIILAVYLVGIGAGSLLAPRLRHAGWLGVLPCVAATGGVASLWALPVISAWAESRQFGSLAGALWTEGAVLAGVTLPVTLVLGAWLPLLAARLGGDLQHGARLYGANSIGAALGAVIAGFLLVPVIGTAMTVTVASLLLFVCGMVWSPRRAAWAAVVLPLALAWPVATFPPVDELMPETHAGARDLYRYEDAMAITHVIQRPDGQRVLLSDLQRMDASTEPAAVELQKNQARLPLLLHPDPRSVLFLGLGTGISAAGSLPYDELQRTAVELSHGAITAAREWFVPVNDGVMRELGVVRDDARRYLRTTDRRFDVIIGDVFHPDLVGRSALLSVQQFERARRVLADDGLFVQWLALNQFDRFSLGVVMRSFRRVFPGAVMFVDGFRLALVGPAGDGFGAAARLGAIRAAVGDGAARKTGGEGLWTWMGRYWGPVAVGGGPVQDEWRPRIEFRLPRVRYADDPALPDLLSWLLALRPRVEEAASTFGVKRAEFPRFEGAYVATDLATRGWLARIEGASGEANRLVRFAYRANPRDRWVGFTLADNMFASLAQAYRHGLDRRRALLAVLEVRADHSEALRELWQLELEAGNERRAREYLQRLRAVAPLARVSHQAAGL